MAKTRNLLTDIEIHEVSLVDRPANKRARILLRKRDEVSDDRIDDAQRLLEYMGVEKHFQRGADVGNDENKVDKAEDKDKAEDVSATMERLQARIAELETKLSEAEKKKAAKSERDQKVNKFLGSQNEAIRKAFGEMGESDQDEFMNKFSEPADPIAKALREQSEVFAKVQKANDDLQARLSKMESDRKLGDLVEELSDLTGKVPDVAAFAKRVIKLGGPDSDEGKAMIEDTRALARQTATTFEVIGKGGSTAGRDAISKVNAEVDRVLKASPGKITKSQALDQVLSENPDLYDQYESERSA